jgi:hypothetical protein
MDKRYIRKLDMYEDQVLTAYENGMTLKELAALYNCSPATIANFLKSRNVPRRKRGPKDGFCKQISK